MGQHKVDLRCHACWIPGPAFDDIYQCNTLCKPIKKQVRTSDALEPAFDI